MSIDVVSLDIPDIKIITPKRIGDHRGEFSEVYSQRDLQEAGITESFVQDNHSWSAKAGTLRGLHFQSPPFAQGKLVRVVSGRIFDVAMDIRRSSPHFGKFVCAEISAENGKQIWIPPGFAHGLCTLEDNTQVLYKVSQYYSPRHDLGLFWNDPDIGIKWPFTSDNAILSDKDLVHPLLRNFVSPFA